MGGVNKIMLLHKKDVAQRQLSTAIRLFYKGDDPISIYSLASNAWEIIDVLCNRAGIESLSNQCRENIPTNLDLKRNYINSPYRNFFKHADNDLDTTLDDFDSLKVDSVLFLAVNDYLRLYQKGPIEFQVYELWYLAIYQSKIATADLEATLKAINNIFPSIEKMSRNEKISIGNTILENSLRDNNLAIDKATEFIFPAC